MLPQNQSSSSKTAAAHDEQDFSIDEECCGDGDADGEGDYGCRSSSTVTAAKQDNNNNTNKARKIKQPPNHQFENFDNDQASMTKANVEICTACDDEDDLNDIDCYLETDDLWKKFHELGTEMIITKSGRRMFPPLRVSFTGANVTQKYIIAMDIVPMDEKRYRYAYHRSSWLVAGKCDPPVQARMFIHPDGPFTGETLYKQIVSFEKVKLTNNEMDKNGHVNRANRKHYNSQRRKFF